LGQGRGFKGSPGDVLDTRQPQPYPEAMDVHLPDSQEARLNELAARTGRGTDELVQEAVARLLAHNERFKQQVQIGIDQIGRGEFIEEDEMDARVERMLQP
jgi:predicted transcriptional regulator